MFPILLIAIGIVVLVVGKRLAVLGAAVGALLLRSASFSCRAASPRAGPPPGASSPASRSR